MIYSHKFNSMPRTKREVSYEAFYINVKICTFATE